MKFNLIDMENESDNAYFIDWMIQKLEHTNVEYWRINYGHTTLFEGIIENKERVYTSEFEVVGIGIFIYNDGGIGFASTSVLSKDEIQRTIIESIKMTKLTSLKRVKYDINRIESEKSDINGKKPIVRKPPISGLEELFNFTDYLKEEALNKATTKKIRVNNISGSIGFYKYHRAVYDSYKRELSYSYPIFKIVVSIISSDRNQIKEGYESVYKIGGGELLNEDIITNVLDNAYENLVNKLNARSIKIVRTDIVADSEFAGTVVHESFGHLSEADALINDTTILKDKIGRALGSEIVNIFDTGEYVDRGIWLPFDDEGIPTKEVKLVENGVFKGFLHSIQTASLLRTDSTGNARSSSPLVYPLVRMRNTYLGAGDANDDELIEELSEGILIKGVEGGETKDTGLFIFTAKNAFYVKNGEVKYPIRTVSIRANILNFLKKIAYVGKKISVSIGFCEKNDQTILVGMGGPSVLVKDVKIMSD